jgi:hypothetical protein
MKIQIVDEIWQVKLFTPKEFIKYAGKDFKNSEAYTDLEKYEMCFQVGHVTEINVRHELFHCYFFLSNTYTATIDSEAAEEIGAVTVGKYGEELIKNSRKLYKQLLKAESKILNV